MGNSITAYFSKSSALIALTAGIFLLGGCGGSDNSPAGIAAKACETEAKSQLGDKRYYKLDHQALASSMSNLDGNERFLSADILIDAGLPNESKQKLECTVRMSDDGSTATVLNQRFIW